MVITKYTVWVGIKKDLFQFFQDKVKNEYSKETPKYQIDDALSIDNQFKNLPSCGMGMILYFEMGVNDFKPRIIREYIHILNEN